MRLYTAQEMAQILHVHVDTVYRYGRQGILQTERVGGSVRFYNPAEIREVQKNDE